VQETFASLKEQEFRFEGNGGSATLRSGAASNWTQARLAGNSQRPSNLHVICKNSSLNEGQAGERQRSACRRTRLRQAAGWGTSTTTRQAACSGRCGGPAARRTRASWVNEPRTCISFVKTVRLTRPSRRATSGHVSWSADKIETCSDQRHLDYCEVRGKQLAAAGVEGLQLRYGTSCH